MLPLPCLPLKFLVLRMVFLHKTKTKTKQITAKIRKKKSPNMAVYRFLKKYPVHESNLSIPKPSSIFNLAISLSSFHSCRPSHQPSLDEFCGKSSPPSLHFLWFSVYEWSPIKRSLHHESDHVTHLLQSHGGAVYLSSILSLPLPQAPRLATFLEQNSSFPF